MAGLPERSSPQATPPAAWPTRNARSAVSLKRKPSGRFRLDLTQFGARCLARYPGFPHELSTGPSLAGMTLRGVAQRFAQDLQRGLEALQVLTNAEQLEAELAAVRADTHAEVSRAEQRVAGEQRARLEASEAAEDALQAAEDARARAEAAEAQAAQAIDEARGAREQVEQAQRPSARAGPDRARTARGGPARARGEAERERDAASAEAERAIERSGAAERVARAAGERSEAADARAGRAEQRVAGEQRARKDRAGFERDLERLRQDFEARLAAQQERTHARERAQAALDADRELLAQLESQLKDSQKRLAAAEKARDAAIAAVEQAARGRTPRRRPGASGE